LSVKPIRADGSRISWATIAAARQGSAVYADLVRWAGNVKAFGGHMYFAFNHEPDVHSSAVFGTPADFIAAWRNVVAAFRPPGARPDARGVGQPRGRQQSRPEGAVVRRRAAALQAAGVRPVQGDPVLEPEVEQLRRLRLPRRHQRVVHGGVQDDGERSVLRG